MSWEQPDFRFKNTSSTSIGIKASYADQKMTVSIYGIPILEEGTKLGIWYPRKWRNWIRRRLLMRRTRPLSRVWRFRRAQAAREADGLPTRWVYKDGKEISREQDHKTTYKGHAPVIRRNTTGVVLAPEETTLSTETTPPIIDGMPDGYIPGDEATSIPSGNGSQENWDPGTVTQPERPPQRLGRRQIPPRYHSRLRTGQPDRAGIIR